MKVKSPHMEYGLGGVKHELWYWFAGKLKNLNQVV